MCVCKNNKVEVINQRENTQEDLEVGEGMVEMIVLIYEILKNM